MLIISRPDHPLSSVFVYTTVCLMDDSKLSCPKCTNLQNLFLIQLPSSQLMPSPSTQASKQASQKAKSPLFLSPSLIKFISLSASSCVSFQNMPKIHEFFYCHHSSPRHYYFPSRQLVCISSCLYTCLPNLFYT